MDKKQSLTPDIFWGTNLDRIIFVFPDLFPPNILNASARIILPEKMGEAFNLLTDKIWEMMRQDTVFKRLKKEEFRSLPLEKQLEIIQQALSLLETNKKAEEFLKDQKGR